MEGLVRAHIFVSGRVQGVFFRAKAKKKAEELGVFGWVGNTPDERVEAVFEGEKEKVEKIIEWSKRGPLMAQVTNIDIEWQEYKEEFSSFKVKQP